MLTDSSSKLMKTAVVKKNNSAIVKKIDFVHGKLFVSRGFNLIRNFFNYYLVLPIGIIMFQSEKNNLFIQNQALVDSFLCMYVKSYQDG